MLKMIQRVKQWQVLILPLDQTPEVPCNVHIPMFSLDSTRVWLVLFRDLAT